MADFCLDCFNEYVLPASERPRREKDVTLTDWEETCDGCGKLKRTVIVDQPESLLRKLFFKLLFKLYEWWERRQERKEK